MISAAGLWIGARLSLFRLVMLAAAVLPATASAAEVQVDGAYQVRARFFDTLSLDREIDESEGLSWNMQHRLWVRPKLYVSDQVGLFLDVLALDNVRWGDVPVSYVDPVTEALVPVLFTDDLRPPTSEGEPTPSYLDLTLWRAWTEVHTNIGTFKVGRMPLHWGMGIWQNDGTGEPGPFGFFKEYGDTTDRVSWEHLITDVWLRAAVDLNTAGFVNQTDETWSLNVAGAYKAERMFGGIQFQYRRSAFEDGSFDLFTLDGTADLRFGIIRLQTELVFQFGNGDLQGGLNDVSLFSAGGAFDGSVELGDVDLHLQVGWATGDDDVNDGALRQFTFDRDFNVGQFMFEQPMPVLTSAVPGEARDFGVVQSGDAVSNVIYLRPYVTYTPIEGLHLDGQVLLGWTARATDEQRDRGQSGFYGAEFDLGLRYSGIQHLTFGGTVSVFVPDAYFKNYTDDTFEGFGAVAAGGQLFGRVHF